MYSAKQSLHAWTSGSASGPFLKPLPVNVALFSWGSLCSHSDRRVTGEATEFLRRIACAILQKVDCPVQQFFSELGDNSTQTHWMSQIRTDSKGNKKVKRVDLKQQTVRLVLPPANVPRSFRQVLTSDKVPSTRHWQCNDHAKEIVDWIGTPPTQSRQSRVVSQNVGPVGIRNSIPTVQHILSSHNPAVVLLQDCRVKNSARKQVHAQLRKEWPQYQIFIRCQWDSNAW